MKMVTQSVESPTNNAKTTPLDLEIDQCDFSRVESPLKDQQPGRLPFEYSGSSRKRQPHRNEDDHVVKRSRHLTPATDDGHEMESVIHTNKPTLQPQRISSKKDSIRSRPEKVNPSLPLNKKTKSQKQRNGQRPTQPHIAAGPCFSGFASSVASDTCNEAEIGSFEGQNIAILPIRDARKDQKPHHGPFSADPAGQHSNTIPFSKPKVPAQGHTEGSYHRLGVFEKNPNNIPLYPRRAASANHRQSFNVPFTSSSGTTMRPPQAVGNSENRPYPNRLSTSVQGAKTSSPSAHPTQQAPTTRKNASVPNGKISKSINQKVHHKPVHSGPSGLFYTKGPVSVPQHPAVKNSKQPQRPPHQRVGETPEGSDLVRTNCKCKALPRAFIKVTNKLPNEAELDTRSLKDWQYLVTKIQINNCESHPRLNELCRGIQMTEREATVLSQDRRRRETLNAQSRRGPTCPAV
jgi:hypothetical protein